MGIISRHTYEGNKVTGSTGSHDHLLDTSGRADTTDQEADNAGIEQKL